MAKFDEIKDVVDARRFALKTLVDAIIHIIPERKVIASDQNHAIPKTPYIVVDAISDVNISGGLSEKPIHNWIDESGVEYYIYQAMTVVDLTAFLGNSFDDMLLLKNRLGNRNIRYEYFLGKGLVGLTDLRSVTKTPVFMDDHKIQQSANMRLTLTWLFAYKDGDGTVVESIYGNLKSDDIDIPVGVEFKPD